MWPGSLEAPFLVFLWLVRSLSWIKSRLTCGQPEGPLQVVSGQPNGLGPLRVLRLRYGRAGLPPLKAEAHGCAATSSALVACPGVRGAGPGRRGGRCARCCPPCGGSGNPCCALPRCLLRGGPAAPSSAVSRGRECRGGGRGERSRGCRFSSPRRSTARTAPCWGLQRRGA